MGAGHSVLLQGGTNLQMRSKPSSACIGWPSGRLQPFLPRECENPDMRAPVSSSAAVLHGAFLEDLPDLCEQLLRGEKLPEVTGKSAQWQSAAVPAVTTRTPHWAVGLDYAAHVRRGSAGSTRWPCSQAGCFRNSFLLSNSFQVASPMLPGRHSIQSQLPGNGEQGSFNTLHLF